MNNKIYYWIVGICLFLTVCLGIKVYIINNGYPVYITTLLNGTI